MTPSDEIRLVPMRASDVPTLEWAASLLDRVKQDRLSNSLNELSANLRSFAEGFERGLTAEEADAVLPAWEIENPPGEIELARARRVEAKLRAALQPTPDAGEDG